MVLTRADGTPIPAPDRADYQDDLSFVRARHAYGDEVTALGNRAFTDSFYKTLRRRRTIQDRRRTIQDRRRTIQDRRRTIQDRRRTIQDRQSQALAR